jgi:hypothetical protein
VNRYEEQRYANERRGIQWREPEEHAADQSRKSSGDDDAKRDARQNQHCALLEHERDDTEGICPERHANTDFLRA